MPRVGASGSVAAVSVLKSSFTGTSKGEAASGWSVNFHAPGVERLADELLEDGAHRRHVAWRLGLGDAAAHFLVVRHGRRRLIAREGFFHVEQLAAAGRLALALVALLQLPE